MQQNDVIIGIKADAGALTKEMSKVSEQADKMRQRIEQTGGTATKLKGAFGNAMGGIKSSIASGVSSLGGLGKAMGTAFTVGLGPIGLVMTGIQAVTGVVESLMDKSQAFGDMFRKIWAQVGAALSYIMDTTNWGTGFSEGLKDAITAAGELADASDAAGTYAMEWRAKQADLNAVLADSQAVMTDTKSTTKEQAAAVEAATKAAADYQRESEKYIAARRAEIEAMVKEVAAGKQLKLTQEELNYIMEEGITDTDALKAAGGKYADFADALSDSTQQAMLEIRQDIKQTEREASQFSRRVSQLVKKEAKISGVEVEVKPTLPAGSIADIKAKIATLTKAQQLTIPFSIDYYKLQGEIDELNRRLTGDDGMLKSIPLKLEVKDVTKNIKLVGKAVDEVASKSKGVEELGGVFRSLGQMVNAVGQESQEAAVAVQALAVAEQIAAMASAIHSASEGDPYTVAARIIAAAAAVTSSIVAIQQLSRQSFAEGGIVQGQFESGDRQLIHANAGEMILTKAQQGTLFNMLDKGGAAAGGGEVTFKIEGRDLVGVLRAYNDYNGRTL